MEEGSSKTSSSQLDDPSSTKEQGISDDLVTCLICMEPFQINESVSWSKLYIEKYRHVYHHDCIVSWLLEHEDCPCCRNSFGIFENKCYNVQGDKSAQISFCLVHGRVPLLHAMGK